MSETFITFFQRPWTQRQLLAALTQRDVLARYKGSALGMVWAFLNPLLLLIVYTFVFGVIFNSRWGSATGSKIEFALVLFAGLMLFSFFAECINRAPGLVSAHPNYVKKVVFPLDLLAWVAVASALVHLAASLIVWLIALTVLWHPPGLWALMAPIVLLPLILYTLGLTWFLSSFGVFLRDLGQVVGIAVTALMFLSPIFYPVASLPAEYQSLMHLNPLTSLIESWRDVLVFNRAPNWGVLAIHAAAALAVALIGLACFHRVKSGFADVV